MIDFLNKIDTDLFLILNQLNHPVLDPVMLTISYSEILFLVVLIVLSAFGIKYYKKYYGLAFLFCVLAFAASDRISSGFFKPTFERLRPCHNQELADKVHLAGKRCGGGKFGFISSHASNSFTFAVFFWLLLRRKGKFFALLFPYAMLISYSRIYLARHYPGDILVGAILGIICGYLGFVCFDHLKQRFQDQSSQPSH